MTAVGDVVAAVVKQLDKEVAARQVCSLRFQALIQPNQFKGNFSVFK
jgi:hypothetical protein